MTTPVPGHSGTGRRISELDETERRREYKRRYRESRREARISREKANPEIPLKCHMGVSQR